MTVNVIIVTLGALLFACAYLFGPKKTVFKTYYILKYALFKPVEWLMRLIIALCGINSYVWMSWGVLMLLATIELPEQNSKFVVFMLLLLYGWLILSLVICNFCDEDDRDFIRMTLAQFEHKLCFKNKQLSMYPDDWHWID